MISRHSLFSILLVLVFGTTPGPIAAAAPVETWVQVFKDPGYSALLGMTLTDEGSILVVGTTNHRHMPPYNGDVLLMSIDRNGDILWERTWGGDGFEQAWGVLPADDGFYVFGETDSYGIGDRDFFLLNTTADGEEIWFRTYGTPQREWPYGALPLANGDLFLFGMSRSSSLGDDSYAVRVDTTGTVVWEYSLATAGDELILDAIETEEGHIVLCLSVEQDGGVRALDADGSEIWSQRYELDAWQFGSTLLPTDAGFLLAGFAMVRSGTRQQVDVWLAEVDASGELLWNKTFGEPTHDDYAQTMLQAADGSFILAGIGRGMPVFKIDGEGNVLWEHRLEDRSAFAARALIALENGGLLVCGMKEVVPMQKYHGVLERLDLR
ncbi:PQQ-binding-like beta-propeller repeat protein [Candidatus Bipolaricaulota bacterium]